jgi:hypothetical protein
MFALEPPLGFPLVRPRLLKVMLPSVLPPGVAPAGSLPLGPVPLRGLLLPLLPVFPRPVRWGLPPGRFPFRPGGLSGPPWPGGLAMRPLPRAALAVTALALPRLGLVVFGLATLWPTSGRAAALRPGILGTAAFGLAAFGTAAFGLATFGLAAVRLAAVTLTAWGPATVPLTGPAGLVRVAPVPLAPPGRTLGAALIGPVWVDPVSVGRLRLVTAALRRHGGPATARPLRRSVPASPGSGWTSPPRAGPRRARCRGARWRRAAGGSWLQRPGMAWLASAALRAAAAEPLGLGLFPDGWRLLVRLGPAEVADRRWWRPRYAPGTGHHPDTRRVRGGPAHLRFWRHRPGGPEDLVPAEQHPDSQHNRGERADTDRGIDQYQAARDYPRDEDHDCRCDHRGAGPDHVRTPLP